MAKKVFMSPTPSEAKVNPNAGIPQVLLNLEKHLPSFGWKITENPENADLIAHHAGSGVGQADVSHIHGLYPNGEPNFPLENWHTEINGRVIESIRTAKAVTVPSAWVGQILARDMHIDPHVINWAVNADEWKHDYPHEKYCLWGKNRIEGVCTPEWINRLAKAMPDHKFVSTFGEKMPNMTIIGVLPHAQMKYFIQRAGVYLSTTKETGDIGSREALASGVPVLGFRQGAITDFVQHGYNGFLAEAGDFDGLLAGLDWCLKHRKELSHNAIESMSHYSWRDVAGRFAEIYDSVIAPKTLIPISVIVPVYNYANFIIECLESIVKQDVTFNYEIIIVNDGSTDNSLEIIHNWMNEHSNLNVSVIDQPNQGVAHARNNGIEAANGEFIACIDADDTMLNGWLQSCASALMQDRGLGIAYAGLQINGNGIAHSFPPDYSWQKHKNRDNQIPSLCMFRKEAWERAGKFRQYRATAEDADMFMRIAAIGYRCKKVSQLPLFNYRMGHTSATTIIRQGQKQDPYTDPNYRYFVEGCAAGGGNYPVRNYDQPEVSVIIPVGKGHEEYVKQALDSVEGQTVLKWEAIVINDTGAALDLTGYPYVRVISTLGSCGAAYARNRGIEAANGDYTVFLDADDYLHPTFLEKAIRKFKQTGRYIYTDWQMLTKDGAMQYHECPEFAPNLIFEIGYFHPITCLVPTADTKKILFDENLSSWEDVDWYMRLIISGCCGVRLGEPLLTYRYTTGNLREQGAARSQELRSLLLQRYNEWIEGDRRVMCDCGVSAPPPEITPDMDIVKVVLNTGEAAKKDHYGAATGTKYRRANGDTFYIRREDQAAEPDKYVIVPDIQPEKAVKTVVPLEPIIA